MNCEICNQPITSLDAVVDDGQGVQLRIHKGCASSVTADSLAANPDYKPAVAKGVWGGHRPLITIKPLVRGEDGRMYLPGEPARKAEAKQPTCLLCGKQASDADRHAVFGREVYGHGKCISALDRSLRGEDVRQVPATRVPVDVNPAVKATPRQTYTDNEARNIAVKALIQEPVLREAVARKLARRIGD